MNDVPLTVELGPVTLLACCISPLLSFEVMIFFISLISLYLTRKLVVDAP